MINNIKPLKIVIFVSVLILICFVVFGIFFKQSNNTVDISKVSNLFKSNELNDAYSIAERSYQDAKSNTERILYNFFLIYISYELKDYESCIVNYDNGLEVAKSIKNDFLREQMESTVVYKILSLVYLDRIEDAEEMLVDIHELPIRKISDESLLLAEAYYLIGGKFLLKGDNIIDSMIESEDYRNNALFIQSYFKFFKSNNYNKSLELIQVVTSSYNTLLDEWYVAKDRGAIKVASYYFLEALCHYKLGDKSLAMESILISSKIYDLNSDVLSDLDQCIFSNEDIDLLKEIIRDMK